MMKRSTIQAAALAALLCACPILQACSDTSSQTTYTTTNAPGDPVAQTTTTTTTSDEPDSVVGSTAHAAGTIIAAPFRIVGDTLGVIF